MHPGDISYHQLCDIAVTKVKKKVFFSYSKVVGEVGASYWLLVTADLCVRIIHACLQT